MSALQYVWVKGRDFDDVVIYPGDANGYALIAAAPDLLQAVKLVMACNQGAIYLNGESGERYTEWDRLASAVAKAEGGAQ